MEESYHKSSRGEDEFELSKIAGEDAQGIFSKSKRTPFTNEPNVHCECRILQHALEYGKMPFYSYIGVSKLSCRGCSEYVEAVNTVHNTNFQTKGCHIKWYYPWAFAPIAKDDEVAARMFYNIAQKV